MSVLVRGINIEGPTKMVTGVGGPVNLTGAVSEIYPLGEGEMVTKYQIRMEDPVWGTGYKHVYVIYQLFGFTGVSTGISLQVQFMSGMNIWSSSSGPLTVWVSEDTKGMLSGRFMMTTLPWFLNFRIKAVVPSVFGLVCKGFIGFESV